MGERHGNQPKNNSDMNNGGREEMSWRFREGSKQNMEELRKLEDTRYTIFIDNLPASINPGWLKTTVRI